MRDALPSNHFNAFTYFVRLDFWFAALFLWIIPLAESWSSVLMAILRAAAAFSFSFEERTFLITDFIFEISALLRAWRRALWRTRRDRPALLETADLTVEDRELLDRFKRGETPETLEAPANAERED